MGRRKRIFIEDEENSSDEDQEDNHLDDDELPEDDDLREEALLFMGKSGRKSTRGSKEDAIYGVFGENRGDENGAKHYKNSIPKTSQQRYDVGVPFVASKSKGHNDSDMMSLDEEDNRVNESSDGESEKERRMSMTEEGRPQNVRPSSCATALPKIFDQQPIHLKSNRDAAASLRTSLIYNDKVDPQKNNNQSASPSLDIQRQKSTTNKRESYSKSSSSTKPAATPSRKKGDTDFGNFEKHTKGIGLKLLQKMGYVPGQGLGRSGEGITAPIDVKLRPSRMGLSFKDFDERTETIKLQQRQKGEDYSSSDEGNIDAKKTGARAKSKAWKKSSLHKSSGEGKHGQKQNKNKTKRYKTVDEIMQESMNQNTPVDALKPSSSSSTTKIIDMRGKEVRVLNNLYENSQTALFDNAQRLPELRHNVQLIANLAETELLQRTSQLRIESTKQTQLEKDVSRLTTIVGSEAFKIDRLKHISGLIENISKLATKLATSSFEPGKFPSLESLKDFFNQLQTMYYDEYLSYSLMDGVVACLTPVMRRAFALWEPLENPGFGRDELLIINSLLMPADMNIDSTGQSRDMTPYEAMMYTIWLPRIRQSLNNDWNPKIADPCIDLIEAWQPTTDLNLIPEWLYLNIIDQLVVPKLVKMIEQWDPKRDSQPLHTWIHPWLPILVPIDRMSTINERIRTRMISGLTNWKAEDPSALAVIQPWQEVFSEDEFASFLSRFILPKLVIALRVNLDLNPQHSNIKPFQAVLSWHNLMGPAVTARLLETEFFGIWLDILYQWLIAPGAQYQEIGEWYRVWKLKFPNIIAEEANIAACFKAALTMMKAGIDAAPIPHPSTLVPEVFGVSQDIKNIGISKKNSDNNVGASFRDYVEFVAGQHNASFLPVGAGRVHQPSGKPLYRLSNGLKGVTVYIDDGVLYAQTPNNGVWKPAQVEDIITIQLC